MKIKKYALQKVLSLSLAGCSVLSVASPALATAIDVAGGSADVPVVVTAEAARFSVTAPTTLPISVDADGVVTVANDVNVINNSHGSVVVSDLSVTGTNGWNVVNYDTNMAKEKVNDTKIAVDINGNESTDGGIDFTAGTFATMAGDTGTDANKAPVAYNAKLPAQATALTDISAVNAVFTVDWNTGGTEINPDAGGTEIDPDAGSTEIDPDGGGSGGSLDEAEPEQEEDPQESMFYTVDEVGQVSLTFGFKQALEEIASSNGYVEYWGWRGDNDGRDISSDPLPALPSNATSLAYMFSDMPVVSLDFSNWDTRNITDMSYMFSGCSLLETVNATDFLMEFYGLNISTLDTSNVTDMSYMFSDIPSLTYANLGYLDTSSVTTMDFMFNNCESLEDIEFAYFDEMFFEYKSTFSAESLLMTNWMFYNCESLETLDLSWFDMSNILSMIYMFGGCSSLTSLDLSHTTLFYGDSGYFPTAHDYYDGHSTWHMFDGCTNLRSLDLRGVDQDLYMGGTRWSFDWDYYDEFSDTDWLDLGAYCEFNGCSNLVIHLSIADYNDFTFNQLPDGVTVQIHSAW